MKPRLQAKQPDVGSGSAFFWQGVLMFLPVLVLAGVGVGSLRQDRLLADQEARERAQQSGRQLAAVFAREAGGEMARFDELGRRWERELDPGLEALRGTNQTGPPLQGGRPEQSLEERMLEWGRRYPDGVIAGSLPAECALSPSGGMAYPREYATAPAPPSWLIQLSTAQKRWWDQIQAGGPGVEEKRRAAGASLLASHPAADAAVGVRFSLLSLELQTNSPAMAVARWLQFAGEECSVRETNGFARPFLARVSQSRRKL